MRNTLVRLVLLVLWLGIAGGCEWTRSLRKSTKPAPYIYQRALEIQRKAPPAPVQLQDRNMLTYRVIRIDTVALSKQPGQIRRAELQLRASNDSSRAAAESALAALRASMNPPKKSAKPAAPKSKPKPEPVKPIVSEVGEASDAVDLNQYYRSVMAMYDPDENDTEKMREFKALKAKMDVALTKAGYTPQQIKQYYMLQFLGQPNIQPNAARTTVGG